MTRHAFLSVLLAAGCGTEAETEPGPVDVSWADLPAAEWGDPPAPLSAAPPPPTQRLHLDAPAIEIGQNVDFVVHGAAPGETVALAVSLAGVGAGPCPPGLGMCVDLLSPRVLRSGTADNNGDVTIPVTVPATVAAGTDVAFQAVANRGPDSIKSNAHERVVTAEVCDDGLDNDANGLPDCEDAGCSAAPGCFESCTDGIDNDADGLMDCDDDECWGVDCHTAGITTTVLGGQIDVHEQVESWWWSGCGLVLGIDEQYDADTLGVWGQVEVTSPAGGNATCTWEFDVGSFDFHHSSYFNLGTLVSSDVMDFSEIRRAGFSITDGCNLNDADFLPKELSFWGRTAKVSEDPADPWGNPDWYVGGTLTSNDTSWQNTYAGACGSTMVIFHDNTFTRDPTGTSDTWTQ